MDMLPDIYFVTIIINHTIPQNATACGSLGGRILPLSLGDGALRRLRRVQRRNEGSWTLHRGRFRALYAR
jgi:hypothetical protein